MSVLATAKTYLSHDPDPETQAILATLVAAAERDVPEALQELDLRFGARLAFGTAGLRGPLGPGTACMNRLVVMQAAFGVGQALRAMGPSAPPEVVVGFDGRHNSRQFAHDTAQVLLGLGVRVALFADPVPTPVVPFTILKRNAHAGVVVTASHNPPGDNGYKVYGADGSQIRPPVDVDIATRMAAAPWPDDMRRPGLLDEVAAGRLVILGATEEQAYRDAILDASARDASPAARDRLSIVYTALHGVGNRFTPEVLRTAGFARVLSVPSQADADPRFPTVAFPNPEEQGALDRALALADAENATLLLANDPDADRIAVGACRQGVMTLLTGNQVGVLLGVDAMERHARSSAKPGVIVTTIVSSPQLPAIAARTGHGAQVTLTGFKWIAEALLQAKAAGTPLLLGYEEALGYCVSALVLDKDGVSAALAVADLAARAQERGKSLFDLLDDIELDHGVYVSRPRSVAVAGADAQDVMRAAMTRIRTSPPTMIDGSAVVRVVDYSVPTAGMPATDALAFFTDDGLRAILRPSGTEPKLKIYLDGAGQATDLAALPTERERLTVRLTRAGDNLAALFR